MRRRRRIYTVDDSPEPERPVQSAWQAVDTARFSVPTIARSTPGGTIAVDDSPEPERCFLDSSFANGSTWQSVSAAVFSKYPFEAEETLENANLLGYEIFGFLNRKLNGTYVLKLDELVGDQPTYFSEGGTFFLYYQQHKKRWQICERWQNTGPGRPPIDLLQEARLGNRRCIAQQVNQTTWLEGFSGEWRQRQLRVDHLMAVPDPESQLEVASHVQTDNATMQYKPSMAAMSVFYSLPEHCFVRSQSQVVPRPSRCDKPLFQPSLANEIEVRNGEVEESAECRVWVGWFPQSVEKDEILRFLQASKSDVVKVDHRRAQFSVAIITFRTLRAAEAATRFDGKFLGGRQVQVGHYDEGADVENGNVVAQEAEDNESEKAEENESEKDRDEASSEAVPLATQLIVDGAGRKACAANGTYVYAGEVNGKGQYKQQDGEAIICFRKTWRIYVKEYGGNWWFVHPDCSALYPPCKGWTTPKKEESKVELVYKENGRKVRALQETVYPDEDVRDKNDGFWGEEVPATKTTQAIQLIVDGAGRKACEANGAYMHAGVVNRRALYKQIDGDTMICFRKNKWKIYVKEYGGKWWFVHPDSSAAEPPAKGWIAPKGTLSKVEIQFKGKPFATTKKRKFKKANSRKDREGEVGRVRDWASLGPESSLEDLLPSDAPEGHAAWQAVKYWPGSSRCVFAPQPNSKQREFQVSKEKSLNSVEACGVIARACYRKFYDKSWDKDQVKKFRDRCYQRLAHEHFGPVDSDEEEEMRVSMQRKKTEKKQKKEKKVEKRKNKRKDKNMHEAEKKDTEDTSSRKKTRRAQSAEQALKRPVENKLWDAHKGP